MTDHLETYRQNLRHVVRPDDASQRKDARHVVLNDYDGLLLRACLEEYIGYGAPSDTHRDIAKSYIEYINMAVRDEEKRIFRLYVHTKEAKQVFEEAVLTAPAAIPSDWVDDFVYEADQL